MKSVVRWHGHDFPHNWEFSAHTEEQLITELAGRVQKEAPKTAPSPKELVAFGQSGCTGIDVISILQKMREPVETCEIFSTVEQTNTEPKVFLSCSLRYEITGKNLNPEKVARAVELSLLKYCGVSAMIERSGCTILPELLVNGSKISIWDPNGVKSAALRNWAATSVSPKALIVGASHGIGRALAHKLAERGFAVVGANRSVIPADALAANEATPLYLDTVHSLSRRAFGEILSNAGLKFDLAILNSGALDEQANTATQVKSAELHRIFDVNLFAQVEMAQLLLPFLSPQPSLFFVSSHMGLPNVEEFNYSSYRLSKCALTFYARQLGRELKTKSIAVAALHPGSVKTQMNPKGVLSPQESAERICLLLEKRDEVLSHNGDFWMVSLKDTSISRYNI